MNLPSEFINQKNIAFFIVNIQNYTIEQMLSLNFSAIFN